MPELILHHYPESPVSEKIRAAFGFKKAAWRSVIVPNVMPKPDLMPLTGGYRRTPVLQIGADIYCDTQLIQREVDRRFPKPTLFPAGHEGTATALAFWADRNLFPLAAGICIADAGDKLPEALFRDRTEFTGRPIDPARLKAAQPHARELLYAQLVWVERMLADGRSFVLGAIPCAADYAIYNPVWMMRTWLGVEASPLDRLPMLGRWGARMASAGNGTPTPMTPQEALDVARESTPLAPGGVAVNDPGGWRAGQGVTVTPDDTGRVPVAGELVTLDTDEIAVRRKDPQVGEIVVHFPRAGFMIRAA